MGYRYSVAIYYVFGGYTMKERFLSVLSIVPAIGAALC